MKTNHKKSRSIIVPLQIAAFLLLASNGHLAAQPAIEDAMASRSLSDYQIISAIAKSNSDGPQAIFGVSGVLDDAMQNRDRNIRKLLRIFRDPGSRLDVKCCTAYYLGELHAGEAADDLAASITLTFPRGGHLYLDESTWLNHPAAFALVAIGTGSIPAIIRNLEESDDEKVRKGSLNVISAIEGDKDVVQLRLKKALEAQKDETKRTRLEAAIKSLETPK